MGLGKWTCQDNFTIAIQAVQPCAVQNLEGDVFAVSKDRGRVAVLTAHDQPIQRREARIALWRQPLAVEGYAGDSVLVAMKPLPVFCRYNLAIAHKIGVPAYRADGEGAWYRVRREFDRCEERS